MSGPSIDLGTELTVEDLAAYTGDDLDPAKDETQRLLDAALGYARNYCGWHVTPIHEDETVTVDGSGARSLSLPTAQLISISAITEDGLTLDPDDIIAGPDGRLYKKTHKRWSHKPQAVTVTMTHGIANAKPFQAAVLAIADRMSLEVGGRLARKKIDDVEYGWAPSTSDPTRFEAALLADYLIWVSP